MFNLEEYVSLVLDATLNAGILRQVEAFRSGFNQVCTSYSLVMEEAGSVLMTLIFKVAVTAIYVLSISFSICIYTKQKMHKHSSILQSKEWKMRLKYKLIMCEAILHYTVSDYVEFNYLNLTKAAIFTFGNTKFVLFFVDVKEAEKAR